MGHWRKAQCGIQEWSIGSNAALMQSNAAMPQSAIAE
jgi:hypothetical protein